MYSSCKFFISMIMVRSNKDSEFRNIHIQKSAERVGSWIDKPASPSI